MLLLRLLSTALCAAVAALVFALVYAVPPAHVRPFPAIAPTICTISRPIAVPCGGVHRATAARADRSPGGVPINVIDVAPGVPAAQIAGLIQLAPGEHVAAVNDRVPASDLEVGALIASVPRGAHVAASGSASRSRLAVLDLTVASATGERRVLVVLH